MLAGGGTVASAPPAGAGTHPAIAASGWQAAWAAQLASSTSELATRVAQAPGATFTLAAGANEALPIVGISWYEALAFCWDGGRLPTVAEHEAAAFGGAQQRLYPWGGSYDASKVATGALEPVGRHSPDGDARWGHADLVGNADEWALDYFGALPRPCVDCANLAAEPVPTRVLLGGGYLSAPSELAQTALLHGMGPAQRHPTVGVRCARQP